MQPGLLCHRALADGLLGGCETGRGWVLTHTQQGGHPLSVCSDGEQGAPCAEGRGALTVHLPTVGPLASHFAAVSLRVFRELTARFSVIRSAKA